MIFITGDIHGSMDIQRLSPEKFPQQSEMTKNDYVIIAGDFGLIWDNGPNDKQWLKWLGERNFTTLFIDGNHENHDLLDAMPVTQWSGGNIHMISESVFHLMRGQIYTIEGLRFFTFGGGDSIDKRRRSPGISWWPREMPSNAEYEEGLKNLEEHKWEVDYVITHMCSTKTFDELCLYSIGMQKYIVDLNKYFDVIEERLKFKQWYFGHYHQDGDVDDKHTVLYRKIIRIS